LDAYPHSQHQINISLVAQIGSEEIQKMATTSRRHKRQRTGSSSSQAHVSSFTPTGTLVVFSDPPVTVEVGRGGTSVELGGRVWEVEVDGEDDSRLRLSVTTMSDDGKDALVEVLAARSHEALQREEEAKALGADLERLMERARQVWVCVACLSVWKNGVLME
jgi:hypothetical protein